VLVAALVAVLAVVVAIEVEEPLPVVRPLVAL